MTHLTVKLQEGCWSGWISLPDSWQPGWHWKVQGHPQTQFIAFWFFGENQPVGPYVFGSKVPYLAHGKRFRLQGNGEVAFGAGYDYQFPHPPQ
jgi:hypothetical protein